MEAATFRREGMLFQRGYAMLAWCGRIGIDRVDLAVWRPSGAMIWHRDLAIDDERHVYLQRAEADHAHDDLGVPQDLGRRDRWKPLRADHPKRVADRNGLFMAVARSRKPTDAPAPAVAR